MSESLFGKLPDGWESTTLGHACSRSGGDVQTGPFGSQLHAHDYVLEGVPSIMPQNIGDNRVIEDGIARITHADAERLRRYRVRKGDVVYSRRGDVERRALIREHEEGWLCGTGCLRVRFGERGVNPVYASYYLGHPAVREWIVRHAHGATMPNLNTSILSALPFVVPPLAEQRAIAGMLGALDDKLELNRRMNETLEAIAQAKFSRMMEEGEPGTLGDIADNPKRGVDPGDVDSQTPYIGLEHMPRRCISLSDWGVAGDVASGKARFHRGEILFGKLRPYFHKVGVAPLDGVCSTDILTIVPKKPVWFGLVLGHLSSKELVDHADACSTGTKMPRASWSDLARYEIALPSEKIAAELTGKIQPLVERIIANIHESRTLAALRDALLPKLLSGELRVPAAAKLVVATS